LKVKTQEGYLFENADVGVTFSFTYLYYLILNCLDNCTSIARSTFGCSTNIGRRSGFGKPTI
jgi:hypothetical protein